MMNSDSSKNKGVTQDLGTDTFVKSTEKDTAIQPINL